MSSNGNSSTRTYPSGACKRKIEKKKKMFVAKYPKIDKIYKAQNINDVNNEIFSISNESNSEINCAMGTNSPIVNTGISGKQEETRREVEENEVKKKKYKCSAGERISQ